MEVGEGQIPQQRISQKDILLKDGETIKLPTVHVSKMTLYHGSSLAGITTFEEGDQQAIGRGVYLTPSAEAARGYANKRSGVGKTPTVYETEVLNIDMVDLRTRPAQEQFAKLFRQKLLDWEQNTLPNLRGPSKEVLDIIKQQRKEALENVIGKIDDNSFKQLRDLTFGWADVVSSSLEEQGYRGLTSVEGEPPAIDFHDSVVIFNPADLTIHREKAA